MLKKSEKLIIIGPSGSGKDWLLRQVEKEGLKVSIKVTTRPKRQNEIDSETYHFKSINEFDTLLEEKRFIVNQDFFNDGGELWKYGILKEEFQNKQAFIMTPGEVEQITPDIRKNCFIVYLAIPRDIREERILHRNDSNDSVRRRLDADEIDFKDFKDFDLKITDPTFEAELVLGLMN